MTVKVYFATTNKHKVKEAKYALKDYGIKIMHLDIDYDESSDDTIFEIVKKAAKEIAEKKKLPVMVEDTGIFFKAYPGFPGPLPKFIFYKIGYDGIFRLLKGKNRDAYFLSAVGFCRPGKKPLIFDGKMPGTITAKIHSQKKKVLPFTRIFIPKGHKKPLSKLDSQEKDLILHRSKAFKKLGRYLKNEN